VRGHALLQRRRQAGELVDDRGGHSVPLDEDGRAAGASLRSGRGSRTAQRQEEPGQEREEEAHATHIMRTAAGVD
jgi:hypothetical protein